MNKNKTSSSGNQMISQFIGIQYSSLLTDSHEKASWINIENFIRKNNVEKGSSNS